jgi:DNA-binding response OmpR family regulator
MKILLLEDELMLNEAITEFLQSRGDQVVSIKEGDEALKEASTGAFDLLILDINVPGIDGLTLLETLHAKKIQTPAIYISALVDIEDISRAFDLGCFDYLKKPFHLKELALRIDKVMRAEPREQRKRVHVRLSQRYSYDTERSTLMFDNVPQALSKRQIQIIDLLANNRGRVVEFEAFRTYVWDEVYVDNATIRAEVNRLKKVLKEDFIQNIRALGYMIDVPG